tara:strand:- start:69 stop:281 length:213 start_codon:yes stop_codon:yes gene_type:complete
MTNTREDTRYNFWWREYLPYSESKYRLSLEMSAKMGDVHNYEEWAILCRAIDKCRAETLRQIKQERKESL